MIVFFVLLASSLPARGMGVRPDTSRVVARVDSLTITGEELRKFATDMPARIRPDSTGQAGREAYLRAAIARKLLYLKARALRLDTVESVRIQVRRRCRARILRLYRQEVIYPRVQVTDSMVTRYVREHQLRRRRLMAGILVDQADTARKVVQELDAGRKWEDVARRHTVYKESLERGGVLGYIGPVQARHLLIPEDLFRNLPIGKRSDVLPLGHRFQIIRFLADSVAQDDSLETRVRWQILEMYRDQAEQQFVDSLARVRNWHMDPAGLEVLEGVAQHHARVLARYLSPSQSAQPLFRYTGGQVTVGQYVDAIWQTPLRALSGWGIGDSTVVARTADEILMGPTLLYDQAVAAGIPQRPDVLRWKREVWVEYLVKELRRREAVAKARVTDAEVERYYREHPEVSRSEEFIDLDEVLTPTREAADQIRLEAEGGADLAALARQRTVRPGAREQAGRLHLRTTRSFIYPQLWAAAQKARPGEITGPVQVEKGFSVFRVVDRHGGQIAPLDSVRAKIRVLVQSEKRDSLFENLLDSLRAEYAPQIEIHRRELVAALPDSMLDRLYREREAALTEREDEP